jgi:hypothetical protein
MHRLAAGSLLFFSVLFFSLAGCDCAGPSTNRCSSTADCRGGQVCIDSMCVRPSDAGRADGGGDAGPMEDTGPAGGDAALGLVIDPIDPVLDASGSPTTVQLHGYVNGIEQPGVTWILDDVVVGTISSSGLFTARGLVAGVAHVTARFGSLTATTTVTVHVHATQTLASLSPADQTALRTGGTADAAFRWLYPYDDTVFPRGLAAPVLQLAGASADAVRVTIDVDGPGFHFEGFFTGGTPLQITLPQAVWDGALASAGARDDVVVGVTKIAAGAVTGPATEHFPIAQGSLTGSIYYNSYNSHLASGGAILRVRFGENAQVVQGGCAVCHSVSANGARIATGLSWSGTATITGTGNPMQSGTISLDASGAPTPSWTDPDGRRYSFGALTPDGARVLSNAVAPGNRIRGLSGTMPSRLYDAVTGAEIAAPSFTSAVQYAVTPQFAPNGSALAFSLFDGSATDSRVLAVMSYDGTMSPPVFGAVRRVVVESDGTRIVGWPSFLPDGNAVIYQDGTSFDTSLSGPSGGSNTAVFADLHMVDLTSCDASGGACAVSHLDRLNGYGPSGFTLPYGEGEEAHSDYEPTVLPVAVGGYYWVVFTSRRAYGNTIAPGGTVAGGSDRWGHRLADGTEVPSVRKKLWIAAIDMSGAPGSDRSHPAFYLSGQELESGNMRGFAALDPCRPDGSACSSAAECCGGFCRETSTMPDGTPVLECVPRPMGCSGDLEACTTTAECCGATMGARCINNHCAQPAPG